MKIASLYADVTLNTSGFTEGIGEVQTHMQNTRTQMQGLQTEANNTGTILDGALGHALGDFLSDLTREVIQTAFAFAEEGVELAASMEEIQNVVDTTFGPDTASRINAWAQTTKAAYGIGRLSAKEYVSTMGATLKGMGIQEDELYEMSTALVGLAGDMASFRNMDTQTTFRKLMSGMTGEMEPLKELGIIMSATNLKAHALMMGIEEDWSKLDSATQTQVRFNYLMQQTADMQGDFAKTSDSYSNQLRLMEENIEQLKLSMGESLLPVLTDIVGWFNSLFGSQEKAAEKVDALTSSYEGNIDSIENTTANALSLVNALEQLSATTEDAASTEMWASILEELENTLPGIGTLIDANTSSITGGTEALRGYIAQWRTTNRELAQMKALEDMFSEYDAMEAQLAKLMMQQQVANVQVRGAQVEMEAISQQLLDTMLAGMEAMGASKADIQAMERFGVLGAENLLMRIGNGGNTGLIMSALLEGGDLWRNKSFGDYFLKGGGTYEELQAMAETYDRYRGVADKYSVDNTDRIADYEAAMSDLAQQIQIVQDILAQDQLKEQEPTPSPAEATTVENTVNVEVTASIDGQEIAAIVTPIVERNISRNIILKAK